MKKKNLLLLAFGIIFFIILFIVSSKKELYFYLNGNQYIEINLEEEYIDEGVSAKYCNKYFEIFCSDLSKDVKVYKRIDKDNKNTYYLNYYIKHNNHNKVLTRIISKQDLKSPTIELEETSKYICPNKEYVEDGYRAYDNVDGNITNKVTKEIKDNKIYYNVSDNNGNKRVVFRDLEYKDIEKPSIELLGNETVYVFLNKKYVDKGVKAYDNCDDNILQNIEVESNVDTSKIGNYIVKYSIKDSSGNSNSITRNVIVYDDYSKVKKNGKVIYLTFDDGPNIYTEDILNVLDRYNVKATFFVTNQFSEYQYLIKKEYENGHAIGVHTLTHNFGTIYSSVEAYMLDFNNMNQIIYNQTGEYTKLFRFPGGSSNTISRFNRGIMTELSELMTENDYYYFDWNVDSMDTSTTNSDEIYENVIKEIEKNDISVVLMHDIKKANIESVDKILHYGLENGYTFLPIDSSTPLVQHKVNN